MENCAFFTIWFSRKEKSQNEEEGAFSHPVDRCCGEAKNKSDKTKWSWRRVETNDELQQVQLIIVKKKRERQTKRQKKKPSHRMEVDRTKGSKVYVPWTIQVNANNSS